MKLSKRQFEQLFQENQLILSFVGMSNTGKTFWSKKLRGIGFRHFNCDDLIEAKLAPTVNKRGHLGIEDVSRWMGQPYDERFAVNQEKYLSLEKEIMEDIFTRIKNGKAQNTVIDTTGSIVHIGRNICDRLKQCSMVIYLDVSEILNFRSQTRSGMMSGRTRAENFCLSMKEEMFKQYLKKSKPVVFGDIYAPKDGETTIQTLDRCYRKLLDWRSALYAEYADVTLPRQVIKEDTTVHQFISLLKQLL